MYKIYVRYSHRPGYFDWQCFSTLEEAVMVCNFQVKYLNKALPNLFGFDPYLQYEVYEVSSDVLPRLFRMLKSGSAPLFVSEKFESNV